MLADCIGFSHRTQNGYVPASSQYGSALFLFIAEEDPAFSSGKATTDDPHHQNVVHGICQAAYCGTGNNSSDLSFLTCQTASALHADIDVPENIARYVFCCTKLRLLQKTPCPAGGLGLDSEVVMPVPASIWYRFHTRM